jgi:hypothetical protein
LTVEWFVFVELANWTTQENPHTAGTCHQAVSRKGICMALRVRKAYVPPCPLLSYCSEQIPYMAGAVTAHVIWHFLNSKTCVNATWADCITVFFVSILPLFIRSRWPLTELLFEKQCNDITLKLCFAPQRWTTQQAAAKWTAGLPREHGISRLRSK